MISDDSFQYAIENTKVLVAPQRRIESFGNTSFRFHLVTELMDNVNQIRIREGRISAERPQIVAPGHYARLGLEGFGEKAQAFAEWLETQRHENLAILKYGFQFKRTDISENILHSSVEEVVARVQSSISRSDEPLNAIIQGVDDAWEVCLLKFTIDLIQQSAGGNIRDFKKHGLL